MLGPVITLLYPLVSSTVVGWEISKKRVSISMSRLNDDCFKIDYRRDPEGILHSLPCAQTRQPINDFDAKHRVGY